MTGADTVIARSVKVRLTVADAALARLAQVR